jgi:hypothetical protein
MFRTLLVHLQEALQERRFGGYIESTFFFYK